MLGSTPLRKQLQSLIELNWRPSFFNQLNDTANNCKEIIPEVQYEHSKTRNVFEKLEKATIDTAAN